MNFVKEKEKTLQETIDSLFTQIEISEDGTTKIIDTREEHFRKIIQKEKSENKL